MALGLEIVGCLDGVALHDERGHEGFRRLPVEHGDDFSGPVAALTRAKVS